MKRILLQWCVPVILGVCFGYLLNQLRLTSPTSKPQLPIHVGVETRHEQIITSRNYFESPKAFSPLDNLSKDQIRERVRHHFECQGTSQWEAGKLDLFYLAEIDPGEAIRLCAEIFGNDDSTSTRVKKEFEIMGELFSSLLAAGSLTDGEFKEWLSSKNYAITRGIMDAWCAVDLDRALSLWRETSPVNINSKYGPLVLQNFCSKLASAGRLDTVFAILTEAKLPDQLAEFYLRGISSQVTPEELPKFLARAKTRPSDWRNIAAGYYRRNPSEVERWIGSLGNKEQSDSAWAGLCMLQVADEEKFRYSLSKIQDPALRVKLLIDLHSQLTPSLYAQLKLETPQPKRTTRQEAEGKRRTETPQSAWAWAATLPEGKDKEHVFDSYAMHWAGENPKQFLEFLATQVDSDSRQKHIAKATAGFVERDAAGFLEWTKTLTADSQVTVLKENWSRLLANDPASAARHASSIVLEIPEFRSMLEKALDAWQMADPDDAAAWRKRQH